MQRIVSKEDLKSTIKELSADFEIIGPREVPSKGIMYESLDGGEGLYLGDKFAIEPIKKFFLEPSSWVLKRAEGKDTLLETISQPDKKRIAIGVRPCEARGLVLLDKIFDPSTGSGSTLSGVERVDSEYKDSFYINNRERTIVVGLACAAPDSSCFCTSMGGTPVENRGMDVLIHEIGGKFLLDTVTDRGKEIFGSLGEEAKDGSAGPDEEKAKDLVKKRITAPESLDASFESDYWASASAACVSCGVCTYLCPTCHCFDLAEEGRRRLRCYDGCAFPDFTLEASGENPRPTKKERYRQKVFHKFDYFKKNFGENLCVGCGRCIRYCPVKIDIADVVDKIPAASNQRPATRI